MKSRVARHINILVLLFLCACRPGEKETRVNVDTAALKRLSRNEFIIKPEEIRKYILQECEQWKAQPLKVVSIKDYYRSGNKFLWLGEFTLTSQTDSLLYRLENSWQHGLNPEVFQLSNIKKDLKEISNLKFDKRNSINKLLGKVEVKLTMAYLSYVCGLNFGFTDPHKILNNLEDEEGKDGKPLKKLPDGKTSKKELYSTPLITYDTGFIEKAMENAQKGNAAAFMRNIQPKSLFYIRLQNELERIRQLEESGFTQIPNLGDTLLQVGDKHYAIPVITKRLIITGELKDNGSISLSDGILTQELLDAINLFRKENQIAPDHSLGSFTIRALNRPPSYYKNRIAVNLERLRWKAKLKKGDRYVLINIASSMLQAIDAKADTMLEMKVCVGNTRNKTPLLTSTIRYMELNPYWNVPQSIIMKEIIPSYRKDSTYFTRNKFRIYDKEGHEISPHSINWSKYELGVPFDIKQDNKEGNSLGRMIFRFPNTHSVYLHDTPARYAFKLNNRAISHGCVRLEKPMDFACFLLGKRDEVTEDRIRLAIDLPAQSEKGKKLKDKAGYKNLEYYSFKTYVPLFIEYYTIYISKDGELIYCEDPYNFDSPLLEALDQPN